MSPLRAAPAAVLAGAVAVLVGCDAPASEAPPPEAGQTEGVFGTVAAAVGGIPSVVMLEPAAGAGPGPSASGALGEPTAGAEATPSAPRPRAEPTIDQRGLQFTPRHLVARVGDTVRVTNSESISHNVHVRRSADDATVLNVDTPPGESASFVAEVEGGYDVLCDVHPGMTAFLFATTAPIATFAEQDGTFRIAPVPAGTYTLSVWSLDERARYEQSVVVRDGAETEVSGASDG